MNFAEHLSETDQSSLLFYAFFFDQFPRFKKLLF